MKKFISICKVVYVTDDENSPCSYYAPYLTNEYNINSYSCIINNDRVTGKPNPTFTLMSGECEDNVLESVLLDDGAFTITQDSGEEFSLTQEEKNFIINSFEFDVGEIDTLDNFIAYVTNIING